MRAFLLQDWTTIKGANTITSVAQGSDGYLELSDYQDVVAWLDVRAVTNGGASAFTLTYETAPAAEEVLFAAMTTAITLTASATPTVTKILLSSATVPVARFVRWKIAQTGATGAWDVTFRIWVVANPS